MSKKIIYILIILFLYQNAFTQNYFNFSCAKDTQINCGVTCFTLNSSIPNLHNSTADYEVNPTSLGTCIANPAPVNTPGTSTNLTIDDRYSTVINLPFTFPFYGVNYSQLVVSTNGIVCFDVSNTGSFSHYGILNSGGTLSATSGAGQNLPSTLYDKAIIMGPYHDLDPGVTASPTKRIKYDIVGVAPYRKWVLSFYKVPLFSSSCNSLFENTHQIVLYESTGIIEVHIKDKQICTSWNQGKAMIGVQNFTQNKAKMVANRMATSPPWGAIGMNEIYRFVPSQGNTLYKKVELFDLVNNLIAIGDTNSLNSISMNAKFTNVCVPAGTLGLQKYIIKATYTKIDNPLLEIIGIDTLNVTLGNINTATSIVNPATCANNNIGTITINIPGGVNGYEFSINNGLSWQTSNIFNMPQGTYSVIYRLIGSTCSNTVNNIIVNSVVVILGATITGTNVKCNGDNNGSIVILPINGTAPYQYSINNGLTFVATNSFLNLAPGSYNVSVKDNFGCRKDQAVTITQPQVLSATLNTTNTNCNPVANGTISVNALGGTSPYSYLINTSGSTANSLFQSSTTFNQLALGNYTIQVKDFNGCLKTFNTTVALTFNLTLKSREDTTICEGISVQMNGLSNGINYQWSPIDGLSSSLILNPSATPNTSTNYIITATSGPCTLKDTVKINVIKKPDVAAGNDIMIIAGDQEYLNGNTTVSNSSYLWTPSLSIISGATTLLPLVRPNVTTNYTLTITEPVNGCKASDDVNVEVVAYCVNVRNAFSPNGDGYHDGWVVTDSYDCIKNIEVSVYNRNGTKVFESMNYRNTWKGDFKGKPLPDATYYYITKFLLINNKTVTKKGDITILR